MKVYITDLEAYNKGHLIGRWVELPMDRDLLAECVEDILYEGRKACNDSHHHEVYHDIRRIRDSAWRKTIDKCGLKYRTIYQTSVFFDKN